VGVLSSCSVARERFVHSAAVKAHLMRLGVRESAMAISCSEDIAWSPAPERLIEVPQFVERAWAFLAGDQCESLADA